MNPPLLKLLAVGIVGLVATGCATNEQVAAYSLAAPGFLSVSAETAAATRGKQTVWI